MKYLGLNTDELVALGALNTAKEISQQPDLWRKIWKLIHDKKSTISNFLIPALKADKLILTGAGTSAFIGQSLVGSYFRHKHQNSQAIATTDLVSHPHDYFSKEQEVLLISFARSGNSPESKAAVALADKLSKKCHHLIITCNADGDLAGYDSANGKLVVLLPPESNDKSLAMTSSYSGMLLVALLIARLDDVKALEAEVNTAADYAQQILDGQIKRLNEIASLDFKRAVFLGSGPLQGTATEAHLKLQELTDGAIICKHDSFLGFRHGPKAVVDTDTLIVYFLSNVDYSLHYEKDLISAMDKGKKALAQVIISENVHLDLSVDYGIGFNKSSQSIDPDFLCLPAVVPAQILGFLKSLKAGLQPDSPSNSGAISRVVEGVSIYELN